MALPKLELLADVYNQLQDDGSTVARTKGDLFEPRNKAEDERLKDIGAAAEPGSLQRVEAAKLKAESEALQAEAKRAEAQAEAAEDQAKDVASGKDDLSLKELKTVAEAEGVSDPASRKAELADQIRAKRES